VVYPLLEITAAQSLGIKSTRFLHRFMDIWVQDSLITPQRDPMDVGYDAATAFLTSAHRFSVELRSGDFGGHSITFTELSPNLFIAFLLVCLGSLSCWKTDTSGISYSAKGSIMVSMISTYTCWSNVSGLLRNRKSRPMRYVRTVCTVAFVLSSF